MHVTVEPCSLLHTDHQAVVSTPSSTAFVLGPEHKTKHAAFTARNGQAAPAHPAPSAVQPAMPAFTCRCIQEYEIAQTAALAAAQPDARLL